MGGKVGLGNGGKIGDKILLMGMWVGIQSFTRLKNFESSNLLSSF